MWQLCGTCGESPDEQFQLLENLVPFAVCKVAAAHGSPFSVGKSHRTPFADFLHLAASARQNESGSMIFRMPACALADLISDGVCFRESPGGRKSWSVGEELPLELRPKLRERTPGENVLKHASVRDTGFDELAQPGLVLSTAGLLLTCSTKITTKLCRKAHCFSQYEPNTKAIA